jgi:hypothetical protein
MFRRRSDVIDEKLEARIRQWLDIEEIKKLQSKYQHLLHMYDWEGIVGLFATGTDDISAEIGQSGLFVGSEGVRRFFTQRMPSPRRGRKGTLLLHMAVNPVIEVSSDGKRARGLWHGPGYYTLAESGGPKADITLGKYAMDYIKEDDEWKFQHLKWYNFTTFNGFWKKQPEDEGVAKTLRDAYAAYQPDRSGTVPPGYDPDKVDNIPQPPLPEPLP